MTNKLNPIWKSFVFAEISFSPLPVPPQAFEGVEVSPMRIGQEVVYSQHQKAYYHGK
jgi:hypothetical protein